MLNILRTKQYQTVSAVFVRPHSISQHTKTIFQKKNDSDDKSLNFIGMSIVIRPNVKFIPDYRSSILTVMHVYYSFNETT